MKNKTYFLFGVTWNWCLKPLQRPKQLCVWRKHSNNINKSLNTSEELIGQAVLFNSLPRAKQYNKNYSWVSYNKITEDPRIGQTKTSSTNEIITTSKSIDRINISKYDEFFWEEKEGSEYDCFVDLRVEAIGRSNDYREATRINC